MFKYVGVFLPLLLIASPASAADPSEWAGIAIYNAKQAVAERFRDPYAAEFRNVWAYRPIASVRTPQAVCGEVNAKNGFGGYDGFHAFVWLPLNANLKPDIDHGTAFIGRE